MTKISIIGGGLSGITAALHLIKQRKNSLEITLFEKKSEKLCRGVAYSSQLPYQLLNVPVKSMSLFSDEPNHFLEWLNSKNISATADDFVSRKTYGDYVEEVFNSTLKQLNNHAITIVSEEVSEINFNELTTTSGKHFSFDKVIICSGNFPPYDVAGVTQNVLNNSSYIRNPWSGEYIEKVGVNDTVFIAGTGLTMVDQVMSLEENSNYKGKIITLSRRGFLPLPHDKAPKYQLSYLPNFSELSMYDAYYWFKNEIKKAEQQGANFRSVFDAIRPHIPDIWMSLSSKDKAIFLRHIRPFWEVHRHRIPKPSYDYLQSLIKSGRLVLMAGRIRYIEVENNDFIIHHTPKGKVLTEKINAQWIVNCIGPQSDHKKINSPLYQNLLKTGKAVTDDLGLGIKISKKLNLISADGTIHQNIFVIGPPTKGTFWESTALNEIRIQVNQLVNQFN
jgi:uncharacterized NAD(P)/FAD-binding protein YdhS